LRLTRKPWRHFGTARTKPKASCSAKRSPQVQCCNCSPLPNRRGLRVDAHKLRNPRTPGDYELVRFEFGRISACVNIFGCRSRTDIAAHAGGQRPKTSKGGTRGKGYVDERARRTESRSDVRRAAGQRRTLQTHSAVACPVRRNAIRAASAYPFCRGEYGAIGRSHMPMAGRRRMTTSP
jgi:hypothetical protein